VGAQAAIGDALLFCDADDEVGTGWLSSMGEALTKYDFVACSVENEKLNGRGTWAHPQRDRLQILRFPPHFPHAGGQSLGVKRWLHEAVGGFDEDLLAHEDTFYCVKIQLKGNNLHFVPNAVVHYRLRTNSHEKYRQARLWGYNETLMYKKCRAFGTPKMPRAWKNGISSWADILRRVARIRSRDQVNNLYWDLGYRVGRLHGSIVNRVVAI
jgi:GT2 family glycosyltransferase